MSSFSLVVLGVYGGLEEFNNICLYFTLTEQRGASLCGQT